ncbi:MAG: dihydrodipicolinate synthase family protein [Balneolaceae bacterium]|nr:dihydrodipicolinate synthase family protein [Balneolaceae bacterium]
MSLSEKHPDIYNALHQGVVIPAHPLALTADRELDEKRQRALTRYYMAAGAGGVAVGVHTTQFEIREDQYNLFEPVLEIASDEIASADLDRPFIKVAGICGPTDQAIKEAKLAVKHGYHLGLVSMGGLDGYTNDELIERTRKIADIIPVFGFYLQPAVGGRILSYEFWKKFVEIENVFAIKVAAFNRYQTIDVVRAVAESDRRDEIALYTGNDDNIVADLLTTYRFDVNGKKVEKNFVGGLLGHWAVWTEKAVDLLDKVHNVDGPIPEELLTLNIEVTDTNAVIFDAANSFHGCIPGIHEILRRQGLLDGTWCLNPDEVMSEGQNEEIDRIYKSYPHLHDDAFVKEHLDDFLK